MNTIIDLVNQYYDNITVIIGIVQWDHHESLTISQEGLSHITDI